MAEVIGREGIILIAVSGFVHICHSNTPAHIYRYFVLINFFTNSTISV